MSAVGSDLAYLTVAELAARISRREVTSSEVVAAMLQRIDVYNPRLNCYGVVAADRAIGHAAALDRMLDAGVRLGPLHGVPIAVKDCIDTAGLPTTAGSRILEGRIPPEDATAVRRLVAAGAVIIGKANLYEWAYGGPSTMWGEVANPWRTEYTTGASSNGSAVVVAAGLASAALGSDMGGSVRIPAAMSGVFGLKPTLGRVSRRGVIPASSTMDHVGPLTHTAADAAILLRAMAGPDPADPHTWGRRQGPGDELDPDQVPVRHLRLGVPRVQDGEFRSPEVDAAVGRAVDVLVEAGCNVVEVDLPSYEDARTLMWAISAAENAETQRENLKDHPQGYDKNVWKLLTVGEFLPATEYVHCQRVRQNLIHQMSAVFRAVDALLMPILPLAPWPGGRSEVDVGGTTEDKMSVMTRYSPLFNLTGHPAATVPFGFTDDDLPVCVQLVAPLFEEATLFRLAAELEHANPHRDRRPPLDEPAPDLNNRTRSDIS